MDHSSELPLLYCFPPLQTLCKSILSLFTPHFSCIMIYLLRGMQAGILKSFDRKGNVYSSFATWLCSLASSQYRYAWVSFSSRGHRKTALHASHLGFYLYSVRADRRHESLAWAPRTGCSVWDLDLTHRPVSERAKGGNPGWCTPGSPAQVNHPSRRSRFQESHSTNC